MHERHLGTVPRRRNGGRHARRPRTHDDDVECAAVRYFRRCSSARVALARKLVSAVRRRKRRIARKDYGVASGVCARQIDELQFHSPGGELDGAAVLPRPVAAGGTKRPV